MLFVYANRFGSNRSKNPRIFILFVGSLISQRFLGKSLEFETLNEKFENGRRLFTIGATVDGELVAEGKGYNKKDASQIAAQLAIEKLGL